MSFPGDSSTISLNIIADPTAAVAGLTAVGASLDDLTASGAATSAGLADLGAALDMSAASATDFGASALDASGSLDAFAASTADSAAMLPELTASIDETAVSMASLSAATDGAAASTAEATTLSDAAAASLGGLVSSAGTMIVTAGLFVGAMAAWTILNDVSGWVQNLIQQMFSLDEQTQKTVNSWQFVFQGKQNAQQLAGWAYQESPKLPFTAMDLRGAISALGAGNLTPQQIETFIPYLADIASTLGATAYGGQGMTLQQAAYAVIMAQSGRSVMLMRDLHVSPAELVKYGLDATVTGAGVKIHDPSTLIPALERFTKARGLYGAAASQETNTFWGAYSSFQDYIQNALQTMGGINPATGQVTPGSMFGDLQNLLINVNDLLAQGQTGGAKSPIGQIVGTGEQLFGGVTSSGGSLLGGFIQGLTQGGAGSAAADLFQKIKDFGQWLNSAPIQKDLKQLGDSFGQFMGQALQNADKVLPDLINAFQDLAKAVGNLWNSMSPAQQANLKYLLAAFVEGAAGILEFAAHILNAAAAVQQFANRVTSFMMSLPHQMYTWGQDMLQQLINGIESKLPSFGGLINNIANTIASHLHFSKPEEGPLANADQWMPDMMEMLASTMDRGVPILTAASNRAAQAIGTSFGGRNFGTAFTEVNGQTPYQQGQTFVEQFTNGAIAHIQSRSSPLATAIDHLMTEVATQVVNNAVQMINRSAYAATVAPGAYATFGARASALGGW